jgi:hypothetical protein
MPTILEGQGNLTLPSFLMRRLLGRPNHILVLGYLQELSYCIPYLISYFKFHSTNSVIYSVNPLFYMIYCSRT